MGSLEMHREFTKPRGWPSISVRRSYVTPYHIRSPGAVSLPGVRTEEGQLKHAGAGMKQRVQYMDRSLTTELEHEVGGGRCAKDGAKGRSRESQERKA